MVASLQCRRKALEVKIAEKNRELKQLCIQEAELTGSLPPEIPLEPGENPPAFRRRVGTSFTYPENLINKLKFKDDDTLASLELEYKIQKGIAEAALEFANDEVASKSVRRKHRMMYQKSQQRLIELEARINLYNNQKIKQTVRPDVSKDFEIDQNISAVVQQNVLPSQNSKILANKCNLKLSQPRNKCPGQKTPVHDLRIGKKMHLQNTHENTVYNQPIVLPKSISSDKNHVSYTKDNSSSIHLPASHELSNKYRDRFGSLDKQNSRSSSVEQETCLSSSGYSNSQNVVSSVLLPNQMYPENSLMRTHSLGNIKNETQPPLVSDKKSSEKNWVETSLDFQQTVNHDLSSSMKLSNLYDVVDHFDAVQFEPSKSHTVVQIGKWQPYREITKPFEMSDFYKYSTRFRKPARNSSFTPLSPLPASQNKGVYQPLKPYNCYPMASIVPSIPPMEETVCPVDSFESNNELCLDESVFANEMLSWYEEDITSHSKTATLV